MTTLGIDFLPSRYEARLAERRRIGGTAAALLVLVLLPAVLSLAQVRRLGDAHSQRDTKHARPALTTTAVNGRCVEIRSDLSFPPPPPSALLERRVFLCRNASDAPVES